MILCANPSVLSRTPPHLRWLLNERAMLAGEIDRRQERIDRLRGELHALQSKVSALDRAVALCNDAVAPYAGGVVRATKERYGRRGALIDFVLQQVTEAGDEGVDTRSLCLRAIARFEIAVDSYADVNRYRDTIAWCLRRLEARRRIEPVLRSRGGHVPSVWRLRKATALTDLERIEAERKAGVTP